MKARLMRLGFLGLTVAAIFAIAVSPAAAKKKQKTKITTVSSTFSQCQSFAVVPLQLGNPGYREVPFTVPELPKNAVEPGGRVTSLNSVGLRITHPTDGNVSAFLVSPYGQVVPLVIGRGGTGDDFGAGATSCGGVLTTFSDLATTPISTGTPPFAGLFKLEDGAQLSGFNQGKVTGIWLILIVDSVSGDIGFLNAASLNISYQYQVRTKVKKKKKK